jgi:hypothetical protein
LVPFKNFGLEVAATFSRMDAEDDISRRLILVCLENERIEKLEMERSNRVVFPFTSSNWSYHR